MKRVRIVNQRRFITSLTFLILISFTIVSFLTGSIFSEGLENKIEVEYTVVSGDTLWSIASEYTPRGKDVRDLIYRITRLNDLKTSRIAPGNTIMIPVN